MLNLHDVEDFKETNDALDEPPKATDERRELPSAIQHDTETLEQPQSDVETAIHRIWDSFAAMVSPVSRPK